VISVRLTRAGLLSYSNPDYRSRPVKKSSAEPELASSDPAAEPPGLVEIVAILRRMPKPESVEKREPIQVPLRRGE
jgi:hypothetical protein